MYFIQSFRIFPIFRKIQRLYDILKSTKINVLNFLQFYEFLIVRQFYFLLIYICIRLTFQNFRIFKGSSLFQLGSNYYFTLFLKSFLRVSCASMFFKLISINIDFQAFLSMYICVAAFFVFLQNVNHNALKQV